MALRWILLAMPIVKATRPFEGTYTIVNKANGRRMFASAKDGLFVVDDSGPIYQDQMWLFAPQDNDSYAIINAANGVRVLAQSATDGETGFFAIDHGPIYQDQRWHVSLQTDGSHAMVNVKSGRRILSRNTDNGKHRFAAVADEGPVQADETWWIINQERDATADFAAELEAEKSRVSRLTHEIAVAKSTSEQINEELSTALEAQRKLTQETETQRVETSAANAKLREVQTSKAKLAQDVEAHRGELRRLQSELLKQKHGKEELLAEVRRIRHEENLKRMQEMERARSAQGNLTDEFETVKRAKGDLAGELETVQRAKSKLIDTLAEMQSQVARLSMQLNATNALNLALASQVEALQSVPACWLPADHMDTSRKLFATIFAIAFIAAITSCGRRHISLRSEVSIKQKRISVLEKELHAEFGDMVRVGDFDGGLGTDFGFCVFNAEINQEAVRLIKVQCPGVKHADVEIELIFNGCEVTVRRQASRGVDSANWKRSFQFKPSDGLFEFREEQMLLEDGFLQLVFRACAFQNRMVLFPRHFNLSDTDADACWDYAVDGEPADGAEAWWQEPELQKGGSHPTACKAGSLADVDTESTASTARLLV